MHDSDEKKLNICMLLPLLYRSDKAEMTVYPTIRVLTYLVLFGHQVTWIIGSRTGSNVHQFRFKGAKVYAVPYKFRLPGRSVPARFINKLNYYIRRMLFILSIYRQNRYDIVLYRPDIGVIDGLIAVYIKHKYSVPFVLELANPIEQRDMLGVGHGILRFWRFMVARFDEILTRYLMHRADLVLPISRTLADHLIENECLPETRILPLPETADIEAFANGDGTQVRSNYGLDGLKVVIYEGVVGKARKLDILLEAFKIVLSKCPEARLLIVGSGDDEERLQKLTKEFGLEGKAIFTGEVPQSMVPDFIAAADVGVSPVPPLDFYVYSSPIKMFEYMAAGKPVVANQEIPEHKNVLQESGGGMLVSWNADDFANAIIELFEDPDMGKDMGKKGRSWVIENRSFEVLARKLETRYLDLTSSRSSVE